MWDQALAALARSSRSSGKRLGDPKIRCSSRCAPAREFSMPGMMDTVLNLGLNDETVEGLAQLTGDERFALRRLPPLHPDVRPHRAGHRPATASSTCSTKRRRSAGAKRHRYPRRRARADGRRVQADRQRRDRPHFPKIRSSSFGWPSRRSSAPGGQARHRLPQLRTRSPTTWAPLSTCRRWSSATWATIALRASPSPATRHRREAALRRFPDERPGRGRGGRHPQHRADRQMQR